MFQTIRAFEELYGRRAADLYDQAAQQNEKARAQYNKAMDTYFQANQAADYGKNPVVVPVSAVFYSRAVCRTACRRGPVFYSRAVCRTAWRAAAILFAPPRADKTLPCRQTPISRRRTSGNTSTTSPRTAAAFGTTSSEASLSRAHRLCAGRRPRDSPVSAANDRFCGGHAPRYCQGSAGTNNPEQRRDSPSVSGRLMALAMNTTSPWGRHLLAKRRGAVALAWAATLLAALLGGGALRPWARGGPAQHG